MTAVNKLASRIYRFQQSAKFILQPNKSTFQRLHASCPAGFYQKVFRPYSASRLKMSTNADTEVEKAQKAEKNAKAEKTIFGKIADKEIKADIIFEDDEMLAFNDVNPQAPVHFLVIPKKPLATLDDAENEAPLLGRMLAAIPKIAKQRGLQDGYRVVINNGRNGAQSVFHLHIHVLGKRQMNWPPG